MGGGSYWEDILFEFFGKHIFEVFFLGGRGEGMFCLDYEIFGKYLLKNILFGFLVIFEKYILEK